MCAQRITFDFRSLLLPEVQYAIGCPRDSSQCQSASRMKTKTSADNKRKLSFIIHKEASYMPKRKHKVIFKNTKVTLLNRSEQLGSR